jgi:hypothetical protein
MTTIIRVADKGLDASTVIMNTTRTPKEIAFTAVKISSKRD